MCAPSLCARCCPKCPRVRLLIGVWLLLPIAACASLHPSISCRVSCCMEFEFTSHARSLKLVPRPRSLSQCERWTRRRGAHNINAIRKTTRYRLSPKGSHVLCDFVFFFLICAAMHMCAVMTLAFSSCWQFAHVVTKCTMVSYTHELLACESNSNGEREDLANYALQMTCSCYIIVVARMFELELFEDGLQLSPSFMTWHRPAPAHPYLFVPVLLQWVHHKQGGS